MFIYKIVMIFIIIIMNYNLSLSLSLSIKMLKHFISYLFYSNYNTIIIFVVYSKFL